MVRDGDDSGYRELDHTADRRIEVWGPDLSSLLAAASRGMYSICDPETDPSTRVTKDFRLEAADRATLLVEFLSELLYRLEADSTLFDAFEFDFADGAADCRASGVRVVGLSDEIKAVTWEDVFVQEDPQAGVIRGAVTFDI